MRFLAILILTLSACTGKTIRHDKDALHFAKLNAFIGGPVMATAPVDHIPIAAHPYMAAQEANALHNSSSASDSETLDILARKKIPRRKKMARRLLHGELMNDTSGGSYFSLSNEGEPIIPAANRHVQRYRLRDDGDGDYTWVKTYDRNMKKILPAGTPMTVAQPDWAGNIWFTTRTGVVGVIDKDPQKPVHVRRLADPETHLLEEIQNAFVVGEDGVFVLSDRAMYALTRDADGVPATIWRTAYDRGTQRKGGAVNQGSGTTPTLSGGPEGYVIFADNADGRIRMNAVTRQSGETLCRFPLFIANESYSEDSMVVIERPTPDGTVTSVLTNNSYGNATPNWLFAFFEWRTDRKVRRLTDREIELAAEIAAEPERQRPRKKYKRTEARLQALRLGLPEDYCLEAGRDDDEFCRIPMVAPAKTGVTAAVEKREVAAKAAKERIPSPLKYTGSQFARGVWRLDIHPDADEPCQRVWTNGEGVGGVLKLSTANGLVYAYTREAVYGVAGAEAWYLTAIDFDTGDTLFRALVGTGSNYNNLQGPVTLKNGTAYMGVFRGLVAVRDAAAP